MTEQCICATADPKICVGAGCCGEGTTYNPTTRQCVALPRPAPDDDDDDDDVPEHADGCYADGKRLKDGDFNMDGNFNIQDAIFVADAWSGGLPFAWNGGSPGPCYTPVAC